MAKHKQAKILPWLSANKNAQEGRFIQVGNSLLLSKKFQKLKPGAQMLYLCMAMESGGCKEFEFTRATTLKYGISETSFDRHKRELLNAGCISLVYSGKNTREANKYSFCIQCFSADN